MKTIAFYAYKGGTGRSLVVANAAKYLARFGQTVFVVDFDLEAPGMHYKLSDTDEPLTVTHGVVDYFAHCLETGRLPDKLDPYQLPVPMPPATHGSIRLMPAGAAPSADYWRTLARLNWHDLFYQPGAKGVAMFLDLKERIRQDFHPDFLLIDARTGITEVGGMVTTVLPDVVVCLMLHNRENVDGARVVLQSIHRAARAPDAAPVQIIPVLTRLPHQEKSAEDRQIAADVRRDLTKEADHLEDTLAFADDSVLILHSDPDLQVRERLLIGGTETPPESQLLRDYLALFERFYFKPQPIDAYVQRLAAETSRLEMVGLGRSLQVPLPISDAYVPLRTTMPPPTEQEGIAASEDRATKAEQDVDLIEVFRQAAQHGRRGVVLLGQPGSGKTTGARQLAWCLANGKTRPETLGLPAEITPVFLRFRNLRRATLEKADGLRDFLDQETRNGGSADSGTVGADLWDGRGGPLLWILDGLDEVVESGARQRVSGWVQEAFQQRRDDWFLITCRFQSYHREGVELGPNFVEFHVKPLDDEQMRRFVEAWFRAVHRKLEGVRDDRPATHAEQAAENDSNELLEILTRPEHQAGHIRELCTNPLLLTILCIVYHDERTLPRRRAELYRHCVRVLLEYWRSDLYRSDLGSLLERYDPEAAQRVLARVAWWMHQEQGRTSAPIGELASEAGKGLARVQASSKLGRDGGRFLERMRDEAGILAMTGEGENRCGFLHLSFQEYLAAEHATREGYAEELAQRAAESWWREVALLSLRHSEQFCEVFFGALLAGGIAEQHPELADRCLQEALYFTPAPFLATLRNRQSDKRTATVLRMLRDRVDEVPELADLALLLAKSPDQETRGHAREILGRCGKNVTGEEKDVFVDPETGITFVWIPEGSFWMGEEHGKADERPVHHVTISQGFWMGKYPVTNAQYARFLEAVGGSTPKPPSWEDPRFNQPEQPVVGVSRAEAMAFCEWAKGRLPTEAEWEYACRAGTTGKYSFDGDEQRLGEYAWFRKNSGAQTQPVGAKKPNPWGLHDMHGNVWEWCSDRYGNYGPGPVTDPTGLKVGKERVFRGGGWGNHAGECRCASRDNWEPGLRIASLGFRMVLPARNNRGIRRRS